MARHERPGSKFRALGLMTLRLIVFVSVAAWASRQFGTPSGLAVLVGAIGSRALFIRPRSHR